MASPHPNQPPGRSDNRADYQAAFLQRVHRLLQLAYESLTPSDYESAEEDDITGDLCKHMKHLTEIEPSARWMPGFSVHHQDPSNDVPSAQTGLPRKGKRRPKIDVRIVCKQQTPNRGYCIEAKRLYRSDSVSEYVDDEGVGAFICGEYAKDDEFGGMIGYVQSGTVQDWLPKIELKLAALSNLTRQVGSRSWQLTRYVKGPKYCFVSTHRRLDGKGIKLFHVLFLMS